MPEHVHAVVWFGEQGQLSEFMKQWKRTSSVRIQRVCSSSAETSDRVPVWQARCYAFNIYSRRKMEEKPNYMHQNPVRAGLVCGANGDGVQYGTRNWADPLG